MVTRRNLLGIAGVAGVVAASGVGPSAASADATVLIDPTAANGAWEGWGTSLAWWANVFGDRDDFADLFFTTRSVPYGGAQLPGLGLTIARYNLGACSWNAIAGERMVASPNIPRFKQIEGFWQDYRNEDPNSSAWNWNADAKQRACLVKATERGAISELFANSPMWWMCSNHNPSGAANGGANLQAWNHRQHALHLAATARRARDSWGVTFRTVDAFNEPSSSWWRANGRQEGCHIPASAQRSVLANLRTELDRQGLQSVQISASDETSFDLARSTWQSFDAATKAMVSQVNVHGYGPNGNRRALFDAVRADGKKLWNSEHGDKDGSGLSMASNLCRDWTRLRVKAWCYWQMLDDTAGWGLLRFNSSDNVPGNVETKFHVLAQFTRHIRPGMNILIPSADNAVAAYDHAAGRLVIVAVNTGGAQNLTFDLSRIAQITNGTATRWTTVPNGSDRYRERRDVPINGKTLRVAFPAGSVQTLQLDGVIL